jgi:hypothetical protein
LQQISLRNRTRQLGKPAASPQINKPAASPQLGKPLLQQASQQREKVWKY